MIRVGGLAVDGLAWALARAPLALLDLLAWGLAWVWWLVVPVRRAVARDNLAQALPELPRSRRGPTLRRMFHDIALGYGELLRFMARPSTGARLLDARGFERLAERSARGEGSLVCAGHIGSWDLGLMVAAAAGEFPVACIVRPPSSPWARSFMEAARTRCGVTLLPPRGSMEEVYRLLAEGHVVVFTIDQRHSRGIPAPFFGRDALTSPALAAAARRTGAPVFMVTQHRQGRGRHYLEVKPAFPLEWSHDRAEDLARTTAVFNRAVEDEIRARPHGWLWLHRRWAMSGRAPGR